jgi:pimeloyl-ACP methyl ester carboxylesterase
MLVPYLVPVSDISSGVSSQALVTATGRFLNIGSVNIYVEDQGPSSEEAVVFIHGFGGSTFTWRNNAPFLANQGYRVIALDLKGFGLSTRDLLSNYSHKSQAKLVAEVLQQLGVKRAYLIGHSMGSSVMFHFAHLYPERVLGLISVDGAVNLKASSPIPSMLLHFPPFQRAGRVFLTRYLNKERFISILESAYYRKEIVNSEVIEGYYNRAIRRGWDESLLGMTRDMPGNVIDFPLGTLEFRTLIMRGEPIPDISPWKNKPLFLMQQY